MRLPTTVKVVKKQTGKSVYKRDKRRVALKPGKRRSIRNKVYWETRRNRSDRNRRKKL